MNIENEINYHGPKKIEVFDLPISREIKSEPEQVDLIEKMSLFSDEERKLILRHNVGVQLTEGCNGKCPFCYQKIDFEVKKKFSQKSVEQFFETYGQEFDKNWAVCFHDKSDPMDFGDFTEIYKSLRKKQPDIYVFVSTSIPEGDEDNFKELINYLKEENNWENTIVRISLAKHNKERVKNILQEIEKESGFEIRNKILVEERNKDGIWKANNKKNPERNVACMSGCEGTIIAPDGVYALVMVAPTIYDPTGERYIKIEPGKAKDQVPYSFDSDGFFSFNNYSEFSRIKKRKRKIISPILDTNLNYYQLETKEETWSLMLSREVYNLGMSLLEIEALESLSEEFNLKNEDVSEYIGDILNQGMERIDKIICGVLKKTENVKTKKMEYFKELSRLYAEKWMLLANFKEKGASLESIYKMTTILNNSNKKEIEEIFKKN